MPSINIDLDFFTNPKVVRLTGRLGASAAQNLIRLWCHVGKHYPDTGGATDWTADEVEAASVWTGEKGALFECLMRLHFIHPWFDGYRIHDWEEHAGHLKIYRERAKRANEKRWGKSRDGPDEPKNASRILEGVLNDDSRTPKAVQCNTKTERERNAREPPEIPDSLIAIAENVLGPTPIGQLQLLAMDGHPMDWMEKAVRETGFRGIRQGTPAVNYTRRILQEWRKQGGPPKDAERTGTSRKSKTDCGDGRKNGSYPGKFAGLDPWAVGVGEGNLESG